MDTITQAILGAGVGEVTLGKKVGNKAPLWGAVAGIIPDLDIIPRHFMNAIDYLTFHRGFSHSLIFSVIAAPIAGLLIAKIHKKENLNWKPWALLFFLGLITHILLDCFTTWGTQVFWPFTYRVAWNTIFVIDPLYTIPFAIILVWTIFTKKENPMRFKLGWIAIGISTFYLMITVVNKQIAEHTFEKAFSQKQIAYLRLNTRPTPFNSILWTGTFETKEGLYEGTYSLLDSNNNIQFEYFPKNHELIDPFKKDKNLQKLIFVSKGLYTIVPDSSGYLFRDFRYGRATSWLPNQTANQFSFEYQISESPELNYIKITRIHKERKFEKEIFIQLWNRILGNIS